MFWNRKKKDKGKHEARQIKATSVISKPVQPPPLPKSPMAAPSLDIPVKPDIPKVPLRPARQKVPTKTPRAQLLEPYDPEKEFMRTFNKLTCRHRAWDIWRNFVTMYACAISNSLDKARFKEREKLYLRTIRKYSKDEQNMFPELVAHTVMALEHEPEQDFLGKIFMDLNLGNERGGQFFTPYHVCELMAKISMGNDVVSVVEKEGYITINDPCCGAGATLIAGIHEAKRQLEKVNLNFQNHVLVVGQDICFTTVLMCYIQLSLLGVAGYIKIANTLTEPISSTDTLENYWFTPMYFFDIWSTRRVFRNLDALCGKEKVHG